MFNPVLLNQVDLTWPDGTVCLSAVDLTVSAGLTGVVGRNGAGKSTLLKLISGELAPTSGTVDVAGPVGVLPQNVILQQSARIADLLGITPILHAITAVESGQVDQSHFDIIGDDWDITARATKELAAAGVPTELDRPVRTLSGGEATLVALVGLRVQGNPVTVLDEPTNNLDRPTRQRLHGLLADWAGTVLVISHDIELLRLVDSIVELRDGKLASFGGNWDSYQRQVAVEQEAAGRALASAEDRLRTEQRRLAEAQTKLAHRNRFATKRAGQGIGKSEQNYFTNRAEKSAARLQDTRGERLSAAHDAVEQAAAKMRADESIEIDLPDPQVAAGRRLAEFTDSTGRQDTIVGPERVGLIGPNGIGKTVLLEVLLGLRQTPTSLVKAKLLTDRVGYLPQRLDSTTGPCSVLENVQRAAPATPPGQIRSKLARFGLRGDVVHRPLDSLSGGERFRAVLAGLLLAEPPAQLLVLDEPTNNLDLRTSEALLAALTSYRGALLVVSHDEGFLSRLGIRRLLQLDAAGVLTEVEPGDPDLSRPRPS